MADGSAKTKAPAVTGRVSHESLALAFVAAQSEFDDLVKDKLNPHLKSKYATLDGVIDAVRPHLNRHGLALMQPPRQEGDTIIVDTVLIHAESNEARTWSLPAAKLPMKMQDLGAAITYARRYLLLGVMGIFPGDDDDGHTAGTAPGRPPQAASRPAGAPQSAYAAKQGGEHVWAEKAIAEIRGPGDADDLRASERWQSLPRSWREALEDKIEMRLEELAAREHAMRADPAIAIAAEASPAAAAGFGERLFDVKLRELAACVTLDEVARWTAELTANASRFSDDERATLRAALKERKAQISGGDA